jgi:aminoglycoside phosphotransferase family enzyme
MAPLLGILALADCDVPIDTVLDILGRRTETKVIETPLSWIILTELHAYKLKKALDVGEARFRSPARRRLACIDEVWRNQRLAPGVYLGVVPITSESNGELRLGGKGAEVEWVIKMRRLRDDRNMLTLMSRRELDISQASELGHSLADLYFGGPPETDQLDALCGRLHRRINDGASRLVEALPAKMEKTARRLRDVQSEFLNGEHMALNLRVCDGRIVDGHGDLRPEHVFFERRPMIIDCGESSVMARKIDALDDLGALAMECEHLGREEVANEVMSVYRQVANDDGFPHLEAFYKSLHACAQAGRHAEMHRAGKPPRDPRGLYKALAYLDLAGHYSRILR